VTDICLCGVCSGQELTGWKRRTAAQAVASTHLGVPGLEHKCNHLETVAQKSEENLNVYRENVETWQDYANEIGHRSCGLPKGVRIWVSGHGIGTYEEVVPFGKVGPFGGAFSRSYKSKINFRGKVETLILDDVQWHVCRSKKCREYKVEGHACSCACRERECSCWPHRHLDQPGIEAAVPPPLNAEPSRSSHPSVMTRTGPLEPKPKPEAEPEPEPEPAAAAAAAVLHTTTVTTLDPTQVVAETTGAQAETALGLESDREPELPLVEPKSQAEPVSDLSAF
jgi:hypothetical protein